MRFALRASRLWISIGPEGNERAKGAEAFTVKQ